MSKFVWELGDFTITKPPEKSKKQEEIFNGVDNYSTRVLTAKLAIKELGISKEAAEALYDVKLDDSMV